MILSQERSRGLSPPRVRVIVAPTLGERRELLFERRFIIGRADDCGVCIKDDYVSRNHAEVFFENGQWWVRDLHSSNGIFVRDQQVELAPLGRELTIRLGIEGPVVAFQVGNAAPAKAMPDPDERTLSHYVSHYFGKSGRDEPAGEHTVMLRLAFSQVQTKQKWKYARIIGVLVLLIVGIGAYAFYQHRQASKLNSMAQDMFYGMKSLDIDIANIESLVLDSHNQRGVDQIRRYQNKRKDMEKNYDRFLSALHVYDRKMSTRERLVLRIARIFGECELAMPPDFVTEVDEFIKRWQASGRLSRAIRTAQDNGYVAKISEELLIQDLPPQFFYLALQESDFDQYAAGPVTRKGIAKGMWQFIPETAARYGLQIGPLVDLRRPDPGDDRDHFDRATKAAARYLKDLYSTDAQASGFLVMACYNWGEDQVLPLVRSLPANPKERNFWRLLSAYRDKIPKETHDYVFYIVAAAVIGEAPREFGFDFDNPLSRPEK